VTVEQPRDALGQFASRECPTTYRLLASVRPVDEPRARPGGGWSVEAPRCPHGHFARWAAVNCRPCR